MQESSPASSVTASSGGCAAAPQRHWSRHVGGADGIELQELRSRRRELAVLVEGARQENALLRIQVDRSTAALDAGGDESQLSQTLKKHTDNVRRMHEQLRHIKTRERSTERQLKKKEAALIRIKEEVKKNRELLDRDGDLPQEDELYRHLATAENSLIAKDNILQDLRDEIDRLTSSHAAALEKERLLQKEKKREIQRLYAHTDELNLRIKMAERELARGTIYTQRAMRLARGRGVVPTSSQSAPEHGSVLTVQQRMKQFDAIRRVNWQEQMQKELKSKRETAERRSQRDAEAKRLRKLDEERLMLEEQEQERMRCEVEKMKELEREQNRQTEEEQRRVAEATERAKDERERELEAKRERLTRDEDEKRKQRYRKVAVKETEDLLKSQNRWYYEGSGVDWNDDRRRLADETDPTSPGEWSHYSKLPPIADKLLQDTAAVMKVCDAKADPRSDDLSSCGHQNVKYQQTSRAAHPGFRRSKHRRKSPNKKSTYETEKAAATQGGPNSD